MRLLALALALVPALASAQSVRYRRPYAEGYRLNYGFDHSGGGGCSDYACGGACYDGHTGSDFGAPFGTTVRAAASGTVIATNDGCADYGGLGSTCGGRCGNYVQIRHGDGSTSIYCHMRSGSIAVRTGASISCGQVLGQSASSGNSSGPHLHFGHRSPGAGSSSDPFAGACSRSTTLWVDQYGYREAPSTTCSDACSPSGESCNGRDDDCDGRTDEDLSRGCGTDVGECVSGTQTCSGGGWGACRGEVAPRPEECDLRDDDCDGRTDEDLARRCGTDVGECVAGTETCESGAWSACRGAIDPVPETCDRLDNDCDGEDDDERICEREEIALTGPLLSPFSDSDVDGDGRADACSATPRFACLASSSHGFTRALTGPVIDVSDPFRAATVRTADLDGDGRADLCAREDDRLACWRSDGAGFPDALPGPAYDEGVTELELADVDADGRLDACARDAAGLRCHLATDHGFGDRVVRLAALSDDAGFADPIHHGSIRFGDLDGDGRADVCARSAEGVDCWPSDGDRFAERILGPRWSDAAGFAALPMWSTLRLADVDGDGGDDLCARTPEGIRCVLAEGRRFGATIVGPPTSSDWDRADVGSTLRTGDVDGDGRDDLCAREPDALRCWLSTGHGFGRVAIAPGLSDADGFTDPARYRSIRLADVDGDGRADLCARTALGLRCWLSTGGGFDRTWLAPAWQDAALDAPAGLATIRVGGGAASSRPRSLALAGCSLTGRGQPGALLAWSIALAIVLASRRRAR